MAAARFKPISLIHVHGGTRKVEINMADAAAVVQVNCDRERGGLIEFYGGTRKVIHSLSRLQIFVKNGETMAGLSEGAKQRLSIVINVTKTVFHYGFLPTVLYLGFKHGADPGMPEITLGNLFW